MKLPEDLQRVLTTGAKIYQVKTGKQGKVVEVTDSEVDVDYGLSGVSKVETYPLDEFKKSLLDDEIVAGYRLTIGNNNNFKVLPREGKAATSNPPPKRHQPKPQPVKDIKLNVGYINFKSGKFSEDAKKGYTKVEYRKAVQKLELEVDEDQLKKLKEMGLV